MWEISYAKGLGSSTVVANCFSFFFTLPSKSDDLMGHVWFISK